MKKPGKSWRSSVVLLAVVSGFAMGIYSLSDTHVLVRYFTDPTDRIIGSLIYVVVGSWIGCLLFVPQGHFLGNWFSHGQFNGWQKPIGKDWWYVCGSGFTGAAATFLTLLGLSQYGPGPVVVLSSASLVLLLMFDFLNRRVDLNLTIPALVVFSGLLLSCIDFKDGIEISIGLILIVLIARNLFYVVSTWFFQTGSRRMDSVNFNFWRFLTFAGFATVFVGVWVLATDRVDIFRKVFSGGLGGAIPFIVFSMVFAFIEMVLESQARRDGGKLSMVSFLKQSAIIPVLVMTYLVNWLWVGSLGGVAADALTVFIRLVGAAIVISGLFLLTRRKLVEEEEKEEIEREKESLLTR